jgi:phosphoadenosine phosphosulfate reductase
MLNENTLFGERDKVKISVGRIREFEAAAVNMSPAGYHVCVSGGKDSSVIQELCIMAGVKCEFVHSHTSVDHPETVLFVRREKERVEKMGYTFRISCPRYSDGRIKTMWNGIEKHGFPSRAIRWCCAELKEHAGKDKYIVTGVRWQESAKRAGRGVHEFITNKKADKIVLNNDNDMRRKLTEFCADRRTLALNPVIDWTEEDVWQFLRERSVPLNPLYGRGYRRVGCIGCPMNPKGRKKDLEEMPKYKAAYLRAGARHLEYRKSRGLPEIRAGKTPEDYFDWWINA